MQNLLSTIFLDERLRAHRYAVAIIFFLTVVAIGSIPGARLEIANFARAVVLHSVAYGTITIFLFTGTSGSLKYRFVRTLLTVAVMGAIDELVQSLLPYRRGTFSDWFVDCTASFVVGLVLMLVLPEPRRSEA